MSWNELSEKEKAAIRKSYKEAVDNNLVTDQVLWKTLFGDENLNPQIKTWDDVINECVANNPEANNIFDNYVLVRDVVSCPDVIKRKLEAAYRIAVLIELGYGGMITNEEWRESTQKHTIDCVSTLRYAPEKLVTGVSLHSRHLIAFHTAEQRDEFLKNNEQLCRDYFMITA